MPCDDLFGHATIAFGEIVEVLIESDVSYDFTNPHEEFPGKLELLSWSRGLTPNYKHTLYFKFRLWHTFKLEHPDGFGICE